MESAADAEKQFGTGDGFALRWVPTAGAVVAAADCGVVGDALLCLAQLDRGSGSWRRADVDAVLLDDVAHNALLS